MNGRKQCGVFFFFGLHFHYLAKIRKILGENLYLCALEADMGLQKIKIRGAGIPAEIIPVELDAVSTAVRK